MRDLCLSFSLYRWNWRPEGLSKIFKVTQWIKLGAEIRIWVFWFPVFWFFCLFVFFHLYHRLLKTGTTLLVGFMGFSIHGELDALLLKVPYPDLFHPSFLSYSNSQRPKSSASAVFYSSKDTVIVLHLINNKIIEMQGSSHIYWTHVSIVLITMDTTMDHVSFLSGRNSI